MYTGWVPNVSGYLSFSHIGGLPVRNRTFSENIYPATRFLEDAKFISLIQERNLSDRPNIGYINANPANGRFTFLLQAEPIFEQSNRYLSGIIFCVPKSLDAQLHELHEEVIDNHLTSPTRISGLTAHALTLYSKNGAAFFAVNFKLEDNGIVVIGSIANAEPNSGDGQLRAFEAYSFLKDVLHGHRFHSPTDDALLELTPDDSSKPDLWADRVAKNLHRSVISSFRSTLASAQVQGLGKLSYLNSFLSVLEGRKIPYGRMSSLDSLRTALEANQARAALEKDEKNLFVTYMTSMAAIALPILFICLQLLQMPCIEGITFSEGCKTKFTVPAIMLTTASMTLAYLPWIALAACLLPAIVILIALRKKLHAYNSGKLALPSWTTDLRDVVLRLAVSSTRLALFVTVAVGAAIAACAGWLIYWLLHR